MAVCQACEQNSAVFHVTLSVVVVGPVGSHTKPVQFLLCERCEINLRQVMVRDEFQKRRIAARLTEEPQYKTEIPVKWQKARRNLPAIVANAVE